MGARSNVRFKQEDGNSIYLYGHWAGEGMADMLQKALKEAKGRWGDECYAIRLCVTSIVDQADATHEETGWGLSTYRTDNEYDVLQVDFKTQKVSVLSRESWHDADRALWEKTARTLAEWSFAEFCALASAQVACFSNR